VFEKGEFSTWQIAEKQFPFSPAGWVKALEENNIVWDSLRIINIQFLASSLTAENMEFHSHK
jgi:hypothetical protein